MQQRRFGGGLGVVVLLVLAVALAVRADDPPVLIAPDVHVALPAAQRPAGELLNESFIMTAQALYLEVGEREGRLLRLPPAGMVRAKHRQSARVAPTLGRWPWSMTSAAWRFSSRAVSGAGRQGSGRVLGVRYRRHGWVGGC
ncbi:hypothetical protein GCM10023080_085870 [Streptomyces pseudoechinosporeus]